MTSIDLLPRLLGTASLVFVLGFSSMRTATAQKVFINRVYGETVVTAGQDENYRVRVVSGAAWPIRYEWDMGDGTKALGNNIVHRYRRPGTYAIQVRAMNPYGADSTDLVVDVVSPSHVRSASLDTGQSSSARKNVSVNARESSRAQKPRYTGNGEYYSWVIETHLDRSNADRAVRSYRESGVKDVRVYVDRSGVGSTAYRVVEGSYSTTGRAMNARDRLERVARRKLSLIAIGEGRR